MGLVGKGEAGSDVLRGLAGCRCSENDPGEGRDGQANSMRTAARGDAKALA